MQAHSHHPLVDIDNIVPYFQPIYNLSTGSVLRYECFPRALTQYDAWMPTGEITCIAREQITAALTRLMVERSNAFCRPRQMHWNINLFDADLDDNLVLETVTEICNQVDKGLCGIEIPYSAVKNNPQVLGQLVRRLPQLFVTVDDVFECSNELLAIIASGINAIKLRGELLKTPAIQQQFISIEKIQQYCETYNVLLIAENIEDQEILDAVADLQIQYGQGFFLSVSNRLS
ncbi:EAL domain-containing protein [Glaciecola sp. 1036]|uniref:EAL domain-containing protein n=1 Tax=Alteromonadaceae TaxID=72275 RepID=UPI003CFE9C49